MTEPISVTASLIAILQLTAEATKYLKDARHGSADRVRLRDEMRNATCLLEMLKDRAEDFNNSSNETLKPNSISSIIAPDGPLALFRQLVENIIDKLVPQDRLRRLAQPFIWPFDKKDVSDMLVTLERLKLQFNLIMQNDIVEMMKVSHLKLDAIDQQVRNIENRQRNDNTEAVLAWISSLSFRAKQISVLEGVHAGTGCWFLQNDVFLNWVKGNVDVLWCPGIPGAGKTRLASLMVDHLERLETSSEWTFAYVYCDYNQANTQTIPNFLSSLLEQILRRMTTGALPPELLSLFELHKRYNSRLTQAQIAGTLRKVCSSYKSILIIIDALDEYSTSEELALEFIKAIQELGTNIKILCTARFSTTFQSFFKSARSLEISARSEDMRLFLEARIHQQARLSKHICADPTLADEIIKAIIERAQGMFLLAALHLESLARKINRKEVRISLQTLPKTLDATYEQALKRLRNQADGDVVMAETVLCWILCARRPLAVLELQHMYATTSLAEGAVLEDDDLPDAEILTGVCGGLIIVDAESNSIRLVHYTAQQYLQYTWQDRLPGIRHEITKISLAYLRLPNFSSGICDTDETMFDRLDHYPFLNYAAHHWGSEGAEVDFDNIWDDVEGFLSDGKAVDVANQVWSLPDHRSRDWSQEFPRNIPALVLAASFDLPDVLRRLVSEGHNLEGRGSDGETPLVRAARFSLTSNVVALLELGARIDAANDAGETALEGAAVSGNAAVVETLLSWGADVHSSASQHWSLLLAAVSSGSIEVVRLLVEAGADFLFENPWGDSALSVATRNGEETIANYLADRGALLPDNVAGRRASVAASRKGLRTLVRRLTANYRAVAERGLERQRPALDEVLDKVLDDGADLNAENQFLTATPNNGLVHGGEKEINLSEALHRLDYRRGFSRRYDMLTELGKGHFASVCLCVNRVTKVRYAAKVLTNPFPLESLRTEISILKEIHHENIVRLVDVMTEDTMDSVYLVTELVYEGELFNWIVMKQKLTEPETRKVYTQLFSALAFMHERGWIHRDIKPENILLSDKNLSIKLADFGLAVNVRDKAATQDVAPEILENEQHRYYSFPVDIWSAGVVMYICLCGFPPFSDELYTKDDPFTLPQQIKMGRFYYPSPYWDSVCDSALELLDGMLTVDTTKRYTITECLQHPWMLDRS